MSQFDPQYIAQHSLANLQFEPYSPMYSNEAAAKERDLSPPSPAKLGRPMFDELCSARLNKTLALCGQRGVQYGDTLKNCQWLVMRSVIKQLETKGFDLTFPSAARAVAMAALVDVKYQRFEGGYKEDNLDDGINYSAVLAELMKEF